MSEHRVEIVEITEVLKHPNADRMEIVPIGGWQTIVAKDEFKIGDKAVYIEPDYMVPLDRPEFDFLRKKETQTHHRMKAVKLRGAVSHGMLIPIPEEFKTMLPGTNVMHLMDIHRYEPKPNPKQFSGGGSPGLPGPSMYIPKFDMESLNNHPNIFSEDEEVIVTEKIHGANARYIFHDGEFHLGSRKRWVENSVNNWWGKAAANNPNIEKMCRNNPDTVFFGEVFGAVQSMHYGLSNDVQFILFAALNKSGKWEPLEALFDFAIENGVPHVPILRKGKFDPVAIRELAETNSRVTSHKPGHFMEGVVITSKDESLDYKGNRKVLKHISDRYWTSKA